MIYKYIRRKMYEEYVPSLTADNIVKFFKDNFKLDCDLGIEDYNHCVEYRLTLMGTSKKSIYLSEGIFGGVYITRFADNKFQHNCNFQNISKNFIFNSLDECLEDLKRIHDLVVKNIIESINKE